MKTLIIVDVQNDYFPGGKSVLVKPLEALRNIELLLEHFRENHLPVLHIQHINTNPEASFFLPGTTGADIHKALKPRENESIIIKHAPNSFYRTELAEKLQQSGSDDLVICGMMTHMCIDTTVRAAKDYGFTVTVPCDACATKDLSIRGTRLPAQTVHDVYMAGLNGMFAQVQPTQQIL